MPTLLNQIVAVEKGVKSDAERKLTDALHLAQRETLFGGIAKTYKKKDDDGDDLPPESTRVQQDVESIIEAVGRALTRLFDVTLTKDVANCEAKADVVIDGLDGPLLTDVPVTYLIFLEKRLVDLRTFVSKLPLLDPAEDWEWDGTAGAWANNPTGTTKSKKVMRAFETARATDKFQAQVVTYQEDVIVGYWTTTKFSGRIKQERQDQLLDRIKKLSEAVKMAREKANTAVIIDQNAGEAVFGYLFAR